MGESSDVAPDFPSGVFCGQKGRIMKDTGDYQFDAASPLMTAASKYGLDVEKIIGGDPAEIAKAQGLGIPVPGAAPGPAASTPPAVQSALATGAASQTPPAPSGTSANQPQPPAPETAPVQPNGKTPFFDNFGSNLAQAQVPATNAPNPPTDTTGAPTVPASISPTGTAQDDPNQRTLQQASQLGMDYAKGLAGAPTLQSQEQAIQAKRTLPPQEYDPAHPEYAPTAGRRIMRGIVGGLSGLAQHGIFGAAEGALNPGAVGATPYGAPTRQFSIAAQQQAAQSAALDKQQTTLEKGYSEDTGRAKDVIQSVNDIGKNAASGQSAQARMDTAAAREETARVAGQLADIRQQVADYESQGKMPTTYEGTVAAAHLEKDPARAAALESAAREMAATEIKKFQFKAASDGENDPRRQPMIDAATAQVQKLNDYQWDADANDGAGGFFDPATPNKIYSAAEFTDMKNQISTKLDQQLTTKKMKPLGVRFGVAATTPGRGTAAAAPAATTPAATANVQPPASLLAKTPENGVVVGRNGETWMKKGGQWTAPPKQ